MIEANVDVLEARLRALAVESDAVARRLRRYRQAQTVIGDLTPQQRGSALAALNVGALAEAYSAAVAAYQATEPIE